MVSWTLSPGMYHAKHAEAGGKTGARRRRVAAKGGATGGGGGEFLGFDDSSSGSDVEAGEKREQRVSRAAEAEAEESPTFT